MKSLVAALALAILPVSALADETPEPPKKEGGCVSGGDSATLAALSAVAVVAVAARRRARR